MRGSPSPILGLGEILWDLLPAGKQPGGAPFNFTFHCHQLGWPAIPISCVGNDELGQALRAEVLDRNLPDRFLQIDPDHATGTVSVSLDSQGQPTYTIHHDVAWDHLSWNTDLASLIPQARAVCFGTLGQRHPVARDTIRKIIEHATACEVLVVLDLNLRPPATSLEVIEESLRRARWAKLNEHELEELVDPLGLSGPAIVDQLADLRRRYDLELVALTRGDAGCLVQTEAREVDCPGVPILVADTIGAGDGFTAALLVAYLEGKSLTHAVHHANRIAALVASKSGGTPILRQEEIR